MIHIHLSLGLKFFLEQEPKKDTISRIEITFGEPQGFDF